MTKGSHVPRIASRRVRIMATSINRMAGNIRLRSLLMAAESGGLFCMGFTPFGIRL
jgi:hypothetical protein